MLENIRDPEKRKLIIKELKHLNLQELVVADARGQEYLTGKSLLELSQNREKDIISVALEIMESTKMKTMTAVAAMNKVSIVLRLVKHNRSLGLLNAFHVS